MTKAGNWIHNFRLLQLSLCRSKKKATKQCQQKTQFGQRLGMQIAFLLTFSLILAEAKSQTTFQAAPITLPALGRFIQLSSNIWSLEKSFGKFSRLGHRKFLLKSSLNSTALTEVWREHLIKPLTRWLAIFHRLRGSFPFFVGPK